MALAAISLVAGVAGGLARLGWPLALPTASIFHGPLMASGFLGTVISLERAVALGSRWAYAAPACSGLAVLLVFGGHFGLATVPWILAPLLLYAVSAAIWNRQPMLHTALLAGGALAWVVAQGLAVSHAPPDTFAAWAFTFLVMTIAAERMEMTRILKPRRGSRPLFFAGLALLVGGAALMVWRPAEGAVAYGAGLVSLAAWHVAFDIARRTIRIPGLPRFAAVALLAGYAWLAVAGVAWMAMPWAGPWLRDAAIHALGLGFVFSMIFAHAPIILPAVAKVRVAFGNVFYVPLALLHLSVAARVFLGAQDGIARQWSGAANAVAIAAFAATVIGRSSGRARAGSPSSGRSPAAGSR